MTNRITLENSKKHLPLRDKTAHKGDSGHVVVIGGAESLVYNQENQFSLCDVANPALATGGVGLHANLATGKKKLVASDFVRAAAEFNCHD